ncbi:hypothetical protein HPP92_028715 [Vanilla planifolia]|uniref:Uncharacterized protein n=1 Tax=Vanilla planifolia TaxID=51239 RepID=A0A835U392_VANPL|nr:hypothetical protein HPP92_028715 [Vanilla planifolia]KAG0446707.1 hypothetical protein HPP92_028698 [Vanilla planifolia]
MGCGFRVEDNKRVERHLWFLRGRSGRTIQDSMGVIRSIRLGLSACPAGLVCAVVKFADHVGHCLISV